MALLRGAAFFSAMFCAVFVRSDEPKPTEIPLKDIWSYQIPGTKDIHELEPDSTGQGASTELERYRLAKGSMVSKIQATLNKYIPADSAKPRPGFAAAGSGAEALRKAYEVIVNDQLPAHSFSDDEDISIVFTSGASALLFEIGSIEKDGTQITIHYRFKNTATRAYFDHFAIIPLGKLAAGKYEVHIEESADSRQSESVKARHVVCEPFSFEVIRRQQ